MLCLGHTYIQNIEISRSKERLADVRRTDLMHPLYHPQMRTESLRTPVGFSEIEAKRSEKWLFVTSEAVSRIVKTMANLQNDEIG
jgi:hypothetical protein